MTRRDLIATGAAAGTALAFARVASADPVVTILPYGRRYTVPGPIAPGHEVYVLGEPPVAPRKTVIILYQQPGPSLTNPNSTSGELVQAFLKGMPAQLADWTICSVAMPSHFFPDIWKESGVVVEPTTPMPWIPAGTPVTNGYLWGWPWRYANGHTLWDRCFLPRVSAAIDSLAWSGYTDPERVFGAGPSRGGLGVVHAMAHEPRLRGGALINPVTRLNDLKPWFLNHPNPEACAQEDVANIAQALANRSLLWIVGAHDTVVNTQAVIDSYRACVAAFGPTDSAVPDHELRALPFAGHGAPSSEHAGIVAWLDARAG
jgi:hypothetical protein